MNDNVRVGKSKMTKLKIIIFESNLRGESKITTKGHCHPLLPLKILNFWPSELGSQKRKFVISLPLLNLLNIEMKVWYTLFHYTPHLSFLFHFIMNHSLPLSIKLPIIGLATWPNSFPIFNCHSFGGIPLLLYIKI